MSKPLLTLWCDSATNRLVSGWQSAVPATEPALTRGDSLGVEVHWVSTITSSTAAMVEVPFPPSCTVTLAIGAIDSVPSDGVFTLTYGANTTADLAHDISATDLQTALNGLASITADGGVTVSKFGISYKVVWNDPGVRSTALTIGATNLFPSSYGESTVSKVGDSVTNHTVLLTLRRTPVAACTSFTTVPDPTISVDSIFPGAWRVSFDHPPRTGTFTLTLTLVLSGGGTQTITTLPIPATAAASEIYSFLSNATNTTQAFTVSDSGQASWDIAAGADITSDFWVGTANVSGISATSAAVGFSSVYGVLNLNTAEMEEFMSGLSSASATLAVNVDSAGTRQTILQAPVTISNELISNATFTLVDMGTVMPVDSVVRYDTSQSLDAAQKLTARTNIGAASDSDVSSLSGTVSTHTSQIASLVSAGSTYAPINNPTFTGLVSVSSSGIHFSDGTTQTTAATGGGGGSYLPLSGGTMTGNIVFDGTSGQYIGKGTFDTSRGGNYGLSMVCSVGYEFNWQAGWLITTEQSSSTPRPLYLDSEAGTTLKAWDSVTDTGTEVSHTGITFSDGSEQETAAPKYFKAVVTNTVLGSATVTMTHTDIATAMTSDPFSLASAVSPNTRARISVKARCSDPAGISSPTITFDQFDSTIANLPSYILLGGVPYQTNTQSGVAGQYVWTASGADPVFEWICEATLENFTSITTLVPSFYLTTASAPTADWHIIITFETYPL